MAMDDASGPGRRPSVPSLAVVVPSFNHARYIGEALRSIFAQDYPRLEVRVIDDGSADGSPAAIARAFEEAGGVPCRLTVRPNRGCSATLNELIEGVDADYVAILNSDDLYMPGRLTRLLAGASPSGPYFAFSGVSFLGEDGAGDLESWHEWYATILAQARALPTAGFALLRMNFSVSSSNFVFSRGLFDAVGGFDERLPLSQDWDFILRALRFVEPVLIPDRLLTYRVHATNTYRDHQATRVAEIEAVFRKFAGWAGLPSANAVAPTPLRWPHFFRTFVHVCTGACRRPLAALLPPELTARGPVDGPATGREREALRRLMHAATSPEGLSIRTCRRSWPVAPRPGARRANRPRGSARSTAS